MVVTQSNATPAPRANFTEWTLVCLLSVNLAWTTLCLGGYRPETMLVTSLLTAITLMVHLIGQGWAGVAVRLHPAGWLFLPFLLYALANVIWVTPLPWLGWHDWILWAHLLFTFWVVLNGVHTRRAQVALMLVVVGLGFVVTIMAGYQRFVEPDWLMLGRTQADQFLSRSSGSFGIPNSLAAFYLLITPAIWAMIFRRRATAVQRVLFGYLGICFLCGLLLTVSRGGWAGLALALAVWPLFGWRRRWWWRLGAMVGVCGAIALAAVSLYQVSPVVRDRYHAMINESGEWTRSVMWRGGWALFRENPTWGSGAGSYSILFEKHRPVHYQMEPQWTHNDYLNTLSDYGLVGFGLFFGAAGLIALHGLSRRKQGASHPNHGHPFDEPLFWQAVAVGILAFATQLFVDFHFKITALGMLFAIIAALLVQRTWRLEAPGKSNLRFGHQAVIALIVLGIGWGAISGVYPAYRSESLRYSSRQALDKLWQHEPADEIYRSTLVSAKVALLKAVKINVKNAQAWADLSMATALWGHVEPHRAVSLGQEAEQYADRALAISDKVPEFWIRKSVGNDMQGNWLSAGGDMIHAMILAPASATTWFYQGFHLSLNPSSVAQARAALDYCLRLDPGYLTAQRLRQQLAIDR